MRFMVLCTYINCRQQATPGGGKSKEEFRRPRAIAGPWKDLKHASVPYLISPLVTAMPHKAELSKQRGKEKNSSCFTLNMEIFSSCHSSTLQIHLPLFPDKGSIYALHHSNTEIRLFRFLFQSSPRQAGTSQLSKGMFVFKAQLYATIFLGQVSSNRGCVWSREQQTFFNCHLELKETA